LRSQGKRGTFPFASPRVRGEADTRSVAGEGEPPRFPLLAPLRRLPLTPPSPRKRGEGV